MPARASRLRGFGGLLLKALLAARCSWQCVQGTTYVRGQEAQCYRPRCFVERVSTNTPEAETLRLGEGFLAVKVRQMPVGSLKGGYSRRSITEDRSSTVKMQYKRAWLLLFASICRVLLSSREVSEPIVGC
ncbi:hypothetical protein F4802DRAFT_106641 [Xylaria palmicola]|nr:hypothetical protein F4802DRAFT_106641 [Xylaria palmicola]